MCMFKLVSVFIIFILTLYYHVFCPFIYSSLLITFEQVNWSVLFVGRHQAPSRSEFTHRLSKLLMSAPVVEEWLTIKHLNSCWSVGDECCWAAKTMNKKMTPTHFVVAFFQRPKLCWDLYEFCRKQHVEPAHRPNLQTSARRCLTDSWRYLILWRKM